MEIERKGKKELLQHIEEQNRNLQKYQARLSDVVKSYKNLIKEKEALENSVRALTEANKNSTKEETESNSSSDDPQKEKTDDLIHFESLKQSLRTLTSEKTRIENELKSDRKRLITEKEELEKQFAERETQWCDERKVSGNTMRELKIKIRDVQRDREKDQQEYGLMLKELQSIVADERAAKEKLEQQVENLKLSLDKMPDKRFEYEKHISELQNELIAVKQMLQVAEGEKKDMPSLLKQLQREMQEMKDHHQHTVEVECWRANDAEDKLKALASVSEERAASLESRLSDLSQMVGNYDKLRQQDQIAIQKLKERVAQLDQENTALAGTIASKEQNYDALDDDTKLDVHTLVERINKLKGYLRVARQNSKRSVGTTGSSIEFPNEEECHLNHISCQKEIQMLKDELQKYKRQVQANENKKFVGAENTAEIKSLKQQISILQEDIDMYKMQLESGEQHFSKIESDLKSCINDLRLQHQQQLNAQSSEFKLKMMELEHHLQKQRERSLKLLEDKDNEISILKARFLISSNNEEQTTSLMKEFTTSEDNGDQLTDFLSDSLASCKKDTHLIHYTQEIARKEVEISALRKARSLAETALRELQQISLLKEEKYQDEIVVLSSKLKRAETIQKGINMEYLKNVVLRYIKSSDANDRSHMLNAIAAILHFTPHELLELRILKQF